MVFEMWPGGGVKIKIKCLNIRNMESFYKLFRRIKKLYRSIRIVDFVGVKIPRSVFNPRRRYARNVFENFFAIQFLLFFFDGVGGLFVPFFGIFPIALITQDVAMG